MAVRIRAFLCLRLVAGRTSVTCLVIAGGRRRLSPWSRMGSPVAGRDRVSGRRPPGRRLEGAGELLRLVGYQIGGDLHDAHSVGGRPVISDHDVAHPQVATALDAHETGQVAWLGLARTGSGGQEGSAARSAPRRTCGRAVWPGWWRRERGWQENAAVDRQRREVGLWLSRRSGSPGCCGSCAGRPGCPRSNWRRRRA